jgi:hypothetical protein
LWRNNPSANNAGNAANTPPRGTSVAGSNRIGAAATWPSEAATRSSKRVVATPSAAC